jgi:hypothetical protein
VIPSCALENFQRSLQNFARAQVSPLRREQRLAQEMFLGMTKSTHGFVDRQEARQLQRQRCIRLKRFFKEEGNILVFSKATCSFVIFTALAM